MTNQLSPVDLRPERRPRRRSALFLLVAAALVALILLAVRCGWDSAGSPPATGEGSVPVGGAPALVINQTSVVAGLYPGAPPQVLSGTFTNSGKGPVQLGAVTAALAGVSGGTGTCSLDSFALDNPVMAVTGEIPVGEGVGTWGGAAIRMLNTSTNQDDCQLVTVQISYAAR